MTTEILSLTVDMDHFGGAQKVMMDVHNGIKTKFKAKVLGFNKFNDLHPKYNIKQDEYVRFTNPFYLNNKVLIVHSRNIMAVIMIIKWVFFLNTKILYVHHNVYSTLKWASFFPKDIISISTKVTENLLGYFNLKNRNIELIYNGIRDEGNDELVTAKKNKIIILYSARINEVKRQLQLVDFLAGKLHPSIEIHFAGTGSDYDQLNDKCKDLNNFKVLGFVNNTKDVILNSDYLMLFSIQEGLPISLIEGAMYGKPLLVNDVGGNIEIGIPGQNGIKLPDDWNDLPVILNNLVLIDEHEYQKKCVESRERYKEMFTYDKMISNYCKRLETMLN
jgi:glycosyltransferase involved in cell wall biosynthesis